MTSLDPWDEDLEVGEPADLEHWLITRDDQANWALRKVDQYQQEIQRVTDNARREVERINSSRDATIKTAKAKAAFFESHLIDYRRRLEEKNPDLPKTYKLPHGVITRRAGSTRIEVTETEEFVSWAKWNDPSLLKMTPLVSRLTDQKDRYRFVQNEDGTWSAVDVTGEAVPGVQRVQDPDTYGCKPS